MKYLKSVVVLFGVVVLIAGCGDDEPVDNNGDDNENEIQESDLISELDEQQASQLCDEFVHWAAHTNEAFCGLVVAWGSGEADDPVQYCEDNWDDCVDGGEGWEVDDEMEEDDCPIDEMAECDATVGTYRDCQAERQEGLEQVESVFTCSLLDEDEDDDDVQTYGEAVDKADGDGEACTALSDECGVMF